MAKHWVPKHRWKLGRNGSHPGYWRTTRQKSKRVVINKRPVSGLYQRRDPKTGYILGYKHK